MYTDTNTKVYLAGDIDTRRRTHARVYPSTCGPVHFQLRYIYRHTHERRPNSSGQCLYGVTLEGDGREVAGVNLEDPK